MMDSSKKLIIPEAQQILNMRQQKSVIGFELIITYSTYLKHSQVFDYHDQEKQNFKKGIYHIKIQKQLYFYIQDKEVVISKTPDPQKQMNQLLFWATIQQVHVDQKAYYQINLNNIAQFRQAIQRKIQQSAKQPKSSFMRKYKGVCKYQTEKERIKDKNQYQKIRVKKKQCFKLNQPLQLYLKNHQLQSNYTICFVVKSFEKMILEQGMILKFGSTNSLKSELKIMNEAEYKIVNINLIINLCEVESNEIRNNKNLHINNQYYLLYVHSPEINEPKDSKCIICYQNGDGDFKRTILDTCHCKSDNRICLDCICLCVSQKINKIDFQMNNLEQDQEIFKLNKQQIYCKICKHAYPQYVGIAQKTEEQNKIIQKFRYFKIMTKHKKPHIRLWNNYLNFAQAKNVEQSQMAVGTKINNWLSLYQNPYISEHHASLICKKNSIAIIDKDSQYGTFIVMKNPKILLPKDEQLPARCIQIGPTVIGFRLNHKQQS